MNFADIPLFEGIQEADCEAMMRCFGAVIRPFGRGQTVLPGDQGRAAVGVLLSGAVDVARLEEDGSESLLEHLTPFSVFGEMLAYQSWEDAGIRASCAADCEVLFIAYDQLIKRCERACGFHSALVGNMLHLMAGKAQALSEKIEILSCRTIRARLSCALHMFARKASANSFDLPFSMSALADYLCVDRCAMSRELRQMKQQGLLTVHRGRVTLTGAL